MLRLEALSKRFGSTVAVDNLDLEVGRGEFLSLLGPSGCGKTTTLRMIAGFEIPTSGRVVVDGRDVTRLPPQRRGFGMVFQSYALFPHLDVFENVAFGLKAQGSPARDIPGRVADALSKVDLAGYEKRAVQALSGGQQQRVALARALAPEPPLLLLDEPLSNLDAALRERTRDELRDLLQRVGITSIFVTHDQEEAFALSDRIAVLREGRLQQVGRPEDLYRAPTNPFVASFVGRTNFVEGPIVAVEDDIALVEIEPGVPWPVQVSGSVGEMVSMMARPEALEIGLPGALVVRGTPPVVGDIVARRFGGATTSYQIRLSGQRELLVTVPGEAAAPPSGRVHVRPIPGTVLRGFPADATGGSNRDRVTDRDSDR